MMDNFNLDMRVRKKVDIFFWRLIYQRGNWGCINLALWNRAGGRPAWVE